MQDRLSVLKTLLLPREEDRSTAPAAARRGSPAVTVCLALPNTWYPRCNRAAVDDETSPIRTSAAPTVCVKLHEPPLAGAYFNFVLSLKLNGRFIRPPPRLLRPAKPRRFNQPPRPGFFRGGGKVTSARVTAVCFKFLGGRLSDFIGGRGSEKKTRFARAIPPD